MEMAREAGFEGDSELTWEGVICTEELEAFAELVRADERKNILDMCKEGLWDGEGIRHHLNKENT
jgi:hypothetical protein